LVKRKLPIRRRPVLPGSARPKNGHLRVTRRRGVASSPPQNNAPAGSAESPSGPQIRRRDRGAFTATSGGSKNSRCTWATTRWMRPGAYLISPRRSVAAPVVSFILRMARKKLSSSSPNLRCFSCAISYGVGRMVTPASLNRLRTSELLTPNRSAITRVESPLPLAYIAMAVLIASSSISLCFMSAPIA
jgi:hypothetical protein